MVHRIAAMSGLERIYSKSREKSLIKFSFLLSRTICCSTHSPRLSSDKIHAMQKLTDCFLISHETYRRSNRFHRNYTRACQINNRWRHARLEERDSNHTSDKYAFFTLFVSSIFHKYPYFTPLHLLFLTNYAINSHTRSNEFAVTRKREI